MPSKRKPNSSTRATAHTATGAGPKASYAAFIPLIIITCLIWYVYRAVFTFPVWFDETIGKALFFGLPVWLFVTLSGNKRIPETFALNKLWPGLLMGVAVGGLFGFATSIILVLQSRGLVIPVSLFESPLFWGEFLLALFTGFWETLFFYSWIMLVWQEKYSRQSLATQVLAVAAIFLVFHLPNLFLRFETTAAIKLAILLFLFAIGQALIFSRWRNGYTLTMSQAIWGMVLLVQLT